VFATITYKYDGDNIKERKCEFNTFQRVTFIYKSYDNMQNPFYKCLGLMNRPDRSFEIIASKNNLLESNILVSNDPEFLVNTYSYKYDNDFPIEVEAKEIGLPYDGFKKYYEYE
jgi:hypothetical protein